MGLHVSSNRILDRSSSVCSVATHLRARKGTQLRAASSSAAGPTVIERRSADIAVLGDGLAGVLTAYALAKRGKKVLLLPNLGVQLPAVSAAPLQPLKLTHASSLAVYLANEAAQYWRGLELLAQAPLLQPCATLEWEVGSLGALDTIQAALQDHDVSAARLTSEEVAGRCSRTLRLPRGSSGLWQQGGAVVRALDAQQAAKTLATRLGVLHKEHLVVRGWRDNGSYFQLKASTALQPDLLSLFEVEQLLLAPGTWSPTCCSLFGLTLGGCQVHDLLELRAAGGSDLQQLPVWTCWSDATAAAAAGASVGGPNASLPVPGLPAAAARSEASRSADDEDGQLPLPSPGAPAAGLPLLPGAARLSLLQQPAGGVTAVQDPWQYSRAAGGQTLGVLLNLPMSAAPSGRGLDRDGTHGCVLSAAQQAAALGVLGTAHAAVRNLGDPREVRCYSRLQLITPDGLPVVGSHPGFEPGRVAVAVPAAGGAGSSAAWGVSLGGCQLDPFLANMAVQVLLGTAPLAAEQAPGQQAERHQSAGTGSSDSSSSSSSSSKPSFSAVPSSSAADIWGAVSVARPVLQAGAESGAAVIDRWDDLQALQHAPQLSEVQLEQRQDEAADAHRIAKGQLI